jgi:RNA polymerase sigma factor (TIGR02999 family)
MANMDDVSRILAAVDSGDAQAASQLLPLVYDDLKRIAERHMAQEKPGQTLSATALVHEVYLRLVGPDDRRKWDHRGHFYFAAAEAMRRILIERARSKQRLKRGGQWKRLAVDDATLGIDSCPDEILALDEALKDLESHNQKAAELVKLRFFGGLGHQEAAEALGIGRRTADGLWVVAKTWIYDRLSGDG